MQTKYTHQTLFKDTDMSIQTCSKLSAHVMMRLKLKDTVKKARNRRDLEDTIYPSQTHTVPRSSCKFKDTNTFKQTLSVEHVLSMCEWVSMVEEEEDGGHKRAK